MTQEEAKEMYSEYDYGVYYFRIGYRSTLEELMRVYQKYPNDVMLSYYIEKGASEDKLFNLNDVKFAIYYQERRQDIDDEIRENNKLKWCDSDCYDLSNEQILRLKKHTPQTIDLMLKTISMHENFIEMLKDRIIK